MRGTRTLSMSPSSDLVHAAVGEVVVRLPKTLPADACVAAARSALEDDHVHMLLLTTDGTLVGTIVRSDLPHADPEGNDTEGAEPALPYAVMEGRTVSSMAPAEEARLIMIRRGQRRLAVIDDQGTLLGLLCLKRRLTGFCSDTDVEARAVDPAAGRARAPARR